MTHNLRYEQFNSDNLAHTEAASRLGEWSDEESMLPLSAQSMKAHRLGLIAYRGNELAGYRAVIASYQNDQYFELGGLIVAPLLRGQGYGYEIAKYHFGVAMASLPKAKYLIFVNEASKRISQRLGFATVEELATLPQSIFEPCKASCKEFKKCQLVGKICCHEVTIWDPANSPAPR